MSEESKEPGTVFPDGPLKLTEEAKARHAQTEPTPEMQERAGAIGRQMERDRKERESAAKIDVEEDAARKGREELAACRNETLRQWKRAGGEEAEFEAAWPDLKRRYLERKVSDSREAGYASVFDRPR